MFRLAQGLCGVHFCPVWITCRRYVWPRPLAQTPPCPAKDSFAPRPMRYGVTLTPIFNTQYAIRNTQQKRLNTFVAYCILRIAYIAYQHWIYCIFCVETLHILRILRKWLNILRKWLNIFAIYAIYAIFYAIYAIFYAIYAIFYAIYAILYAIYAIFYAICNLIRNICNLLRNVFNKIRNLPTIFQGGWVIPVPAASFKSHHQVPPISRNVKATKQSELLKHV